ncbi:MAG: hypothetical protein GXC70_05500 [Sphingomonadaceae bacterium]|nr:hypothetical protein [Sphingomonadaceae bacterium]
MILNIGEKSQLLIPAGIQMSRSALRKTDFVEFSEFGTVPAITLASAETTAGQIEAEEMTMTQLLVLISGTVSMPQSAQASTVYVGDLA